MNQAKGNAVGEFYTKLAQKIVYSSLWEEDGDTCKVWITLLALRDHDTGVVDKNITGIARICNLPLGVVDRALGKFQSPDANSTSPDHDGRRVEKLESGWLILNHQKYLEYGWSEAKREYERARKAAYREKRKPAPPDPPDPPKRRPPFVKPTVEEIRALCVAKGLPPTEAEVIWNYYESNGWMVGRARMASVAASVAGWAARNRKGTYGKFEAYRPGGRQGVDRNEGTANAGQASQYEGVGEVGKL